MTDAIEDRAARTEPATARVGKGRQRPDIATLLLLALSVIIAGTLAWRPLITNDGPVHMQFVHHLVHRFSDQTPLQHLFYETGWQLQPNLLIYAIAYPFVALGQAGLAEGLIQAGCVLFPAWGALFAARQISPMGSWAGLAVLALSINLMLMLGQYNTLLSYGFFFLAAGFAIRLTRHDNVRDALLLALCMALATASHAAGFMGAFLGCSSLLGVRLLADLWSGDSIAASIWRRRWALAALFVSGALSAVLMLGAASGGGVIEYGLRPLARMRNLATLRFMTFEEALRPVFLSMGLFILALGAVSVLVVWRDRGTRGPERLWLCAGLGAAAVTALMLALVFPDSTGGAWTHFRRLAGFVFFWTILLVVAANRTGRTTAILTGLFLTLAVVNFAATERLDLAAQRGAAPLREVDRLVGAHCTLLPLVWATRPFDANGQPIESVGQPYFQILSRLEMQRDRVILFNYLGRLQVYPSRFRPGMEPQAGIFHWGHNRQDFDITTIDVDGFEGRSGAAVDYLLIWGQPPASQPTVAREVDRLRRAARPVYASPDGRMTLLRREGQGRSSCTS